MQTESFVCVVPLSVFSFPCLHGQAESDQFTVSVFPSGALVIPDVLSNNFTRMCIHRYKYLQVKEIENVVKKCIFNTVSDSKIFMTGAFLFYVLCLLSTFQMSSDGQN